MNTSDNDKDWNAAEKALEAACRLPGGRDRIEALKRAGRLRFVPRSPHMTAPAKMRRLDIGGLGFDRQPS